MIPKLMLADHTLDGGGSQDKITFPKLVLPKYDGIRIYIQDGAVYARSGKLIPNCWIQSQLKDLPTGVEGEVVVNGNFADTTSCLRSFEKRDYSFKLYLFDNVQLPYCYLDRLLDLYGILSDYSDTRFFVADSHMVTNFEQLLQLESEYVAQGYEGVILRDPEAKYKHGRATFKEQSYLSMKRYMTDNALVIGYKCKLEDGAEVDTLGALHLNCGGVKFWCGSGLNDQTRSTLWLKQDELIGKTVEFKYQKSEQTAPRFPVFLRLL